MLQLSLTIYNKYSPYKQSQRTPSQGTGNANLWLLVESKDRFLWDHSYILIKWSIQPCFLYSCLKTPHIIYYWSINRKFTTNNYLTSAQRKLSTVELSYNVHYNHLAFRITRSPQHFTLHNEITTKHINVRMYCTNRHKKLHRVRTERGLCCLLCPS